MSWSDTFETPIPLPDGGEIRSIDDARAFLNRLSSHEANSLVWQVAISAVLLVGEAGCPADIARAALVEALHRTADPLEEARVQNGIKIGKLVRG
jgi:hypothetical protein